MADIDGLIALHNRVHAVYNDLLGLCDAIGTEGLSSDTVFAIGEAAGIASRAKALVARDIDDAKDGRS